MANTEEQKIRGIRMYLGTIVDSAKLTMGLVGEEKLEIGENQEVTVDGNSLSGIYHSLQGKYQIQVRRIK